MENLDVKLEMSCQVKVSILFNHIKSVTELSDLYFTQIQPENFLIIQDNFTLQNAYIQKFRQGHINRCSAFRCEIHSQFVTKLSRLCVSER